MISRSGGAISSLVRWPCEHMFVTTEQTKARGPRMKPGETRAAVGVLRDLGYAYNEIAAELGVSKSTVAYHARRLGIPAVDKYARRYDWVAIQRAYDSGLSVRGCAARFGFNLATWHQAKKRGVVRARPQAMAIEELLVDKPTTDQSLPPQAATDCSRAQAEQVRTVRTDGVARRAPEDAATPSEWERQGQPIREHRVSLSELPCSDPVVGRQERKGTTGR
jgi:hypothetical protein